MEMVFMRPGSSSASPNFSEVRLEEILIAPLPLTATLTHVVADHVKVSCDLKGSQDFREISYSHDLNTLYHRLGFIGGR